MLEGDRGALIESAIGLPGALIAALSDGEGGDAGGLETGDDKGEHIGELAMNVRNTGAAVSGKQKSFLRTPWCFR